MTTFLQPLGTLNLDQIGDLVGGVEIGESIKALLGDDTNYQNWTTTQINNAIQAIQARDNYVYAYKEDGNNTDTGINSFSKFSINTFLFLEQLKTLYLQRTCAIAIPYDATFSYNINEKAVLDGVVKTSRINANLGNDFSDSTYWKITIPEGTGANTKKFSVNSGLMSSDSPAFITRLSDAQIQVLAGGTNPDLITTNANGTQKTISANETINVLQNGNYCVINSDSGSSLIPFSLSLIGNITIGSATIYSPKNFATQGTATRTNANAILTAIAGINWLQVAIGKCISGTGIATTITATVDRTNNSNTLTNVILTAADWAKMKIGKKISGTGIPANTYITAFNNTGSSTTSTITMSANATSSGSAFALTINNTPKIVAFDSTALTITMDTNAISSGTLGAIQIYEDADLTVFKAGMPITGTGVATSATISSIDATNKTITMSSVATANTDLLVITATQTGIYEQTVQPTTPIDGEFWVQINPLKTYKYLSSVWSDYSFVKLGKITKSNGVIGTPICYALNGFNSGTINSIALSTTYTIQVNIGSAFNISGRVVVNSLTGEGYDLNCVSSDSGLAANGSGTLTYRYNNDTLKIITAQTSFLQILGGSYHYPSASNNPYIEYYATRIF